MVTKTNRGHRDPGAKKDHPDMRVVSCQHRGGVRHPRKIRADVNAVGDEQGAGPQEEKRARSLSPQRIPPAHPRDHPDPCAHELNASHQRPGKERGPQQRRARLRADDRVGSDPRWIVIRGARGHPRTKRREKPAKKAQLSERFFLHDFKRASVMRRERSSHFAALSKKRTTFRKH